MGESLERSRSEAKRDNEWALKDINEKTAVNF
jgi:hypothetical protein